MAPERVGLGPVIQDDSHPVLCLAEHQLNRYFAGDLKDFSVPLDVAGTPFQRQVWSALLTIPFGETRSYGAIAAQIGRPSAARAVGAANGRNPVSIIAPCHRVIGAQGALTGFAGGLGHQGAAAGAGVHRLPSTCGLMTPLANGPPLWRERLPWPPCPDGNKYGRGHALMAGGHTLTGAIRMAALAATRHRRRALHHRGGARTADRLYRRSAASPVQARRICCGIRRPFAGPTAERRPDRPGAGSGRSGSIA